MKQKNKIYLAIDFDGTVVTHNYPTIGKDIGAVQWLKKITDLGGLIILWTMRSDDRETQRFVLTDAVDWYKANDIPLYGINKNPDQYWSTSNKAYAHCYVDDAAYGCPLVYPENERPYVDWSIVGPGLVKMLGG